MLSLARPSRATIDSVLAAQRDARFTYAPSPHRRAGGAPPGYRLDHHRIELGHGEQRFAAAVAALREWRMFDLGWVSLCWPDTPIEAGRVVGALARTAGLWWLNPCRIVEVAEEGGRRFGFLYRTLPGHAERGEERFEVENDDDGRVWFSIQAISRPGHPLAWLGAPWVRRLQLRFAHDSLLRMRRAVAGADGEAGP